MLSQHEATPAGLVVMALLFLFLLSHVIWSAWGERKAGIPVDMGSVVRLGIAFLMLAGFCVYEAFVHSSTAGTP